MSPNTKPVSAEKVVADTIAWLEKAVIGLNLCPFAKAVHVKDQIRYKVSEASNTHVLLADFIDELLLLAKSDAAILDTSLLIHPLILTDFLDFNDFLDVVNAAIDDLGLTGEFQVASFHPDYQFAGTADDDISNYTNRSPYPTLHLLREASIERAVSAFPDAAQIYERNIACLQQLGHAGWKKLGIETS